MKNHKRNNKELINRFLLPILVAALYTPFQVKADTPTVKPGLRISQSMKKSSKDLGGLRESELIILKMSQEQLNLEKKLHSQERVARDLRHIRRQIIQQYEKGSIDTYRV